MLLVDETKIGDRVAAMVVGVAWEGRCIPLAWRCYTANSSADYLAEGQVAVIGRLLAQVQAGMDPHCSVLGGHAVAQGLAQPLQRHDDGQIAPAVSCRKL